MTSYSQVIELPYVDAGMTSMRQKMLSPLLITVPSFEFETSNFIEEYLYESHMSKKDDDKKTEFVKRINAQCKAGRTLWSTLDMIKRFPYSHDGGKYTVYTHFKKAFGELLHTGPWSLNEGDKMYILPPLEVTDFIDRNNLHVAHYKINKNQSEIYTHPMILSDTRFLEFYREVMLIKEGKQNLQTYRPNSGLGRILGNNHMKDINFEALVQIDKPIAIISHKTGISGYDNKINVGDKMTITWLNR